MIGERLDSDGGHRDHRNVPYCYTGGMSSQPAIRPRAPAGSTRPARSGRAQQDDRPGRAERLREDDRAGDVGRGELVGLHPGELVGLHLGDVGRGKFVGSIWATVSASSGGEHSAYGGDI